MEDPSLAVFGIITLLIWLGPVIVACIRGSSKKGLVLLLCFGIILLYVPWFVAWYIAFKSETTEQVETKEAQKREILLNHRLEELTAQIQEHNKSVIRESEAELLQAYELHQRQLISDEVFEIKKQTIKRTLEDKLINPKTREEMIALLEHQDSQEKILQELQEQSQNQLTAGEQVGAAATGVLLGAVLSNLFDNN